MPSFTNDPAFAHIANSSSYKGWSVSLLGVGGWVGALINGCELFYLPSYLKSCRRTIGSTIETPMSSAHATPKKFGAELVSSPNQTRVTFSVVAGHSLSVESFASWERRSRQPHSRLRGCSVDDSSLDGLSGVSRPPSPSTTRRSLLPNFEEPLYPFSSSPSSLVS